MHPALTVETSADDLMIVSDVYDSATRLRSFKLIADAACLAVERPAFSSETI
ncbi:hypothetical protein [Methylovirgula ligni]|uniref:hypothetical protein n=1 Tax=Methylovirgula ligni TaxID=569860 RepID=UPI00268A33FF